MMSGNEMKERLMSGESGESIAVIVYQRRLKIVENEKIGIRNGTEYKAHVAKHAKLARCPVCVAYRDHCSDCSLPQVDKCCSADDSAFDQICYATCRVDLIAALKNMISVLNEADEYRINNPLVNKRDKRVMGISTT